MPFDFSPSDARSLKGLINYNDGLAAEDSIEVRYTQKGYDFVARRWRGEAGEIDLVFRDDEGFVFVEVKKSATFDRAAEHLSMRQLQRICAAAEEFCGQHVPDQLVNMRVDLAMVDGSGRTEVLQNISL